MIHRIRTGVKPKQSLGQNFLIDDNIARNIVRDMCINPDDVVIEIGPGQGALTKHIAGKVRTFVAVEVDNRVIEELRNKFQSASVEIVHQDFLKVSLSGMKKKFNSDLKIVGNIPYHLTSPILFKVFEERDSVQDITFMIQKEVAKRIISKPNMKNYGILSVFSQFYGVPKILFDVSPNCFYPKPKVTSTVVQIELRHSYDKKFDYDLFRSIVRTVFGKRRKTFRNCLKYLPFDEDTVRMIIDKLDFPMGKRPEQLTVNEFVWLTNNIKQIISEK